MTLGFYFNANDCIGCRTCQVACKERNGLDVGYFFREVRSFETGVYPDPHMFHYSGSCNHCENAKCVSGCPTGALHYGDDGTVQHDETSCIGCKYCVWNCPYGQPQYMEKTGTIRKCDSCKPLRGAGENPVCVDSCIMRCLKFGDLEELKKEYGSDPVREIPILPKAEGFTPSLLIKPKAACTLDPNFTEVEI